MKKEFNSKVRAIIQPVYETIRAAANIPEVAVAQLADRYYDTEAGLYYIEFDWFVHNIGTGKAIPFKFTVQFTTGDAYVFTLANYDMGKGVGKKVHTFDDLQKLCNLLTDLAGMFSAADYTKQKK